MAKNVKCYNTGKPLSTYIVTGMQTKDVGKKNIGKSKTF